MMTIGGKPYAALVVSYQNQDRARLKLSEIERNPKVRFGGSSRDPLTCREGSRALYDSPMPDPLRVLFIGNTGIETELSGELSRAGFEPSVGSAHGFDQLEEALNQKWDIAVAHFSSRQFGALEALRIIR